MQKAPLSTERAAKRQAILDAAVEIFAQRGFLSARTRQIAEAAGVAEGTIYLYFEGKDDLLLTAFRDKVEEFCEAVVEAIATPEPFPVRLTRFVEMQFGGIEEDPDLATVLLLETRQSARFYGEPVRDVLREYAAAVDRLLESGVQDGSVREDINVPLVRRMLIGALEEIEMDWLLGPRSRSLVPLASDVARHFHLGIAPAGG